MRSLSELIEAAQRRVSAGRASADLRTGKLTAQEYLRLLDAGEIGADGDYMSASPALIIDEPYYRVPMGPATSNAAGPLPAPRAPTPPRAPVQEPVKRRFARPDEEV